jgi:hypothetical protein
MSSYYLLYFIYLSYLSRNQCSMNQITYSLVRSRMCYTTLQVEQASLRGALDAYSLHNQLAFSESTHC